MLVTIALAGGLKDIYLLVCIAGLCVTTMAFGWVTEALSRPFYPRGNEAIGTRPEEWSLPRRWARLLPHTIGWLPMLVAYGVIVHSFHWNTRDAGDAVPSWVPFVVWGQAVVFSSFGIVQIAQQWSDAGCKYYYVGELAYIILSFVAKGMLGVALLTQVLSLTSLDEALAPSAA